MGADHPQDWAREKRRKLDDMGSAWREWTTKARDVSLPGVPLAALAGFCANGNEYNTTGWRDGDDAERAEAERRGRRPFKRGLRGDYGGLDRSGDLHELGWWGTEAGKTHAAVATDPDCPWVSLADDDEVVKVLGRRAVTGGAWYGAIADQCAIGCANLRRHMRAARRRLADVDARLSWADDDKRATLWRWLCASASWSAGSGGLARHVAKHAAELASLDEGPRVGRFLALAARDDDPGNRHRQDEWTALRWAQKHEAAVLFAPKFDEPWALAWLRADGLTEDERGAIYARLVEVT